MLLASVLFCLGAHAVPADGAVAEFTLPRLEPAVTRGEIEAHVRWLASDELAGRVTGTPECDRAARYLARVLEASGVEPAGDDGTFLQTVPLERTSLTAVPVLAWTTADGARRELAWGADFDAPWSTLVLEDRALAVVRKAEDLPKTADASRVLFVDAPTRDRRRWLAEAGLGAGEGFAALLVPGGRKAGTPRSAAALHGPLRRPQAERAAESDPGAVERVVRVHGAALEELRTGAVRAVTARWEARAERVTSSNVVGRIRGRARDGAERAVVLSAHYDHIAHGHAPSAPGEDTIYNGADDDASGVAVVLELAGALARGERPDHGVIVLLATGEEIGLLGTKEYLDRPVVPLERTIANLNFEMLGRPDQKAGGPGVMWLTGDDQSNLGAALRKQGIRVVPDPRPEQHFYERSDNYAFVLRGVIGQTFSTYDLHGDYHRPSDEADTLDYEHLAACAREAEKAVRLVVSGALDLVATPTEKRPRRR